MKRIILAVTPFVFMMMLHTGCDRSPGPEITTGSLFGEMTDMRRLSVFPDPAYRCIQFSSFDHRSTLPGGPDWFANSDGFGNEPVPNFEQVLKQPGEDGTGEYLVADVTGPGAIVRLWTARIGGNIKVFIDNNKDPVYNGDAEDFFMRTYDLYEELDRVDRELFGKTVYQRNASYAPIPFARHLRVIWTGRLDELHFYQLQVRLYAPDARVRSFSPGDIATYAATIDSVISILSAPGMNPGSTQKEEYSIESYVAPDSRGELLELKGPGAIERLSLKIQAPDMEQALRQAVLNIRFDGYPWGQVQAPVGDFFGAAPGINPYQSMPFTVDPEGMMTCRFFMPFRDSCSITIENFGSQQVKVSGSLTAVDNEWTGRSMHFRARWRADHNITASPEAVFDLPFLIARGQGLYVGTTSCLMNPVSIPTSWGNWWGEGDEKVFVDDDLTASIFGTGSEDYYNYAWSSADIFSFPYCGQPRNDGPANRGYVTNYRWHILDPIPFSSQLSFYMELFPHYRTPGLSYARIGYYYARPGTMDDHLPLMPDDAVLPPLPRHWEPVGSHGSAGALFLQAEDMVPAGTGCTVRKDPLWSGRGLLVWEPGKPGDKLDMKLDVKETGTYRVNMILARMPSSGKIKVWVNGSAVGPGEPDNELDLYRPYRVLSRNSYLGEHELEAGTSVLTLEYTGSAGQDQSPEIGIDFVWLQKTDN